MSHSLLTPKMILQDSLMVLHTKLNFIGNINRQYKDDFAKTGAKAGDTVNIRLPNKFTVTSGRTYVGQSVSEQSIPLTISHQDHVGMDFYSSDLSLTIDRFRERYIEPAMAVLAAKLETQALSMVKDIPNAVGTPGTTPASMTTILNAGALMTKNICPPSGRKLLIDPDATASMVNALSSLFNDKEKLARQYREGMLSKNTLGFDWFESPHIPVLTTGSRDNSTPVTNGAGQTGASLVCSGFDALATIKKGDIFTLANVYNVHDESKVAYADLKQFTVTADATADGAGAVTLSISPSIVSSGAYQNVSAAPASGVALTFAGSASTNYPMNIAFNQDAFTFATVDLEMYSDSIFCERQVYDGISMRFWQKSDPVEDRLITRLDVLYGFKKLRDELACRVWG